MGELTFRQRWANTLTIVVAVVGLGLGILTRSNDLNATLPFRNAEFGISAQYPAAWVRDESGAQDGLVFRAIDVAAIPFKTALSITVRPIGGDTRLDDLVNSLDVTRSLDLPAYRLVSRTPITLAGGQAGVRLVYSYAFIDPNPFLEAETIAVLAEDVVVLRRGQAVIATFTSELTQFERNVGFFESFLASLQF
jgi:hypothetical protein